MDRLSGFQTGWCRCKENDLEMIFFGALTQRKDLLLSEGGPGALLTHVLERAGAKNKCWRA